MVENGTRLTTASLPALFDAMDGVRMGVVGDFCLDVYWRADMRLSDLSRETPHHPLPVTSERFSPGAAGNVAVNAAALGVRQVKAFGMTGEDWRADPLLDALAERGVDAGSMLRSPARVTNAYIKPYRFGHGDVEYEDPRIDFENRTLPNPDEEAALLQLLENAAYSMDVLCVCDQLAYGCVTPAVRNWLARQSANGLKVIVDSRDRAALYPGALIKPNALEAARTAQALGLLPTDAAPAEEDLQAMSRIAQGLAAHTGHPCILTLGAMGCLLAEDSEVYHQPAFPTPPPVDICGSGDAFLAALACAWGAGALLRDAITLACCAASVTVGKVGTTGSASRTEIQERLLRS